MRFKFFILALVTVFGSGSLYSQAFNKEKMDSLFDVLSKKNKAMGSLMITKNGAEIYSRNIGYSCITDKVNKLVSENTKYRIGSISKMFTATMIFQLVEEKKIKLNTTLDTYFPNLPNSRKITIGNMLNHRSGLHNFTSDPEYFSIMSKTVSQEEMLALFAKNKVDFEANEKTAYSNTNFVVLGYILEKICKKPYAQLLKERITSKINLTNTYFGGITDTSNNECYSYKFISNWMQMPESNLINTGGAGSIVSTTKDLTKFIEALFSLQLISKTSLNQMKTITNGYGMGIMEVVPFYNTKSYGHGGTIDGFNASLTFFPDHSIAVAYCSNGTNYPLKDIMNAILSINFNKEYSIPAFNTITLKSDELDKYLGVYSSQQIPLKITISKDSTTLIAQATGQSSFPLEPKENDKFVFEAFGIQIYFITSKEQLLIKQGGVDHLFTKDK